MSVHGHMRSSFRRRLCFQAPSLRYHDLYRLQLIGDAFSRSSYWHTTTSILGGEIVKRRELSAQVFAAAALLSLGCEVRGTHVAPVPRYTQAHRELAEALAHERLVLPRLALFEQWAPCEKPVPGANGISVARCTAELALRRITSSSWLKLRDIGVQIERDARDRPDGTRLHALGVWLLVRAGDNLQKLDAAAQQMEQATRLQPTDAGLQGDLGACYYVRAMRTQRPEDLVRSLAASDEALRLDREFEPALFNRALALQALFQRQEAIRAWRAFLAATADRAWAREAGAELARAKPPSPAELEAVDSLHELVGAEQLLATANSLNEDGANPNARLASKATALARQSGDVMLREEVAVWRVTRSGPHRARLKKGYADYLVATQLYANLRSQAAGAAFVVASRELAAAGSPLRYWADYFAAVCRYWDGDLAAAAARFQDLLASPHTRPYPLLRGHAAWMLGLIATSQSDYDLALRLYRQALDTLRRARSVAAAGFVRVLLAETLRLLNDPHGAWDQLYQALGEVDAWSSQRRRQNLFDEVAADVRDLGLGETALYFQRQGVQAALAGGQQVVISEALAHHALQLFELGRGTSAAAGIEAARRHLERIDDPAVRRRSELDLLPAEARILGVRQPDLALQRLDAAIRGSARRTVTAVLPEIQRERARLLVGRNREDDAEAALLAATQSLESGSNSLAAGNERSALLARDRGIYDDMIRFQLDVRHAPHAALGYVERSRVSEFMPTAFARPAAPHPLQTLQRGLPADGAVIAYHLLDDRLLTWVIERDAVFFDQHQIRSGDLALLIEGFRTALRQTPATAAVSGSAARLYKLLFGPAETRLDSIRRLWLLPDGPLFRLPLRALYAARWRQCIGQRFTLSVILTLGLTAPLPAAPAPSQGPATTRLLLIADPEFDPARFPELPRLGSAGDEARTVASCFPRHTILSGSHATRGLFLTAAVEHDILHFAGHAIANREAPDYSLLVLAPSAGDQGALYAKDIETQHFGRLRLVVLAACNTGGDGQAAAGTFASLARPFLAAGAREVVGSLWPVDDHESSRFFTRFYPLLRQANLDAAAALQRVSGPLASGEPASAPPSSTWAAFETYLMRPDPE